MTCIGSTGLQGAHPSPAGARGKGLRLGFRHTSEVDYQSAESADADAERH
jgi:hypothetical protein